MVCFVFEGNILNNVGYRLIEDMIELNSSIAHNSGQVLTKNQIGFFFNWFGSHLVLRLVVWFVCFRVGWLFGWMIGCLVGFRVVCLVGFMVGCLFVCLLVFRVG